jgi:NAD(P)H-dependent FMN reductase
VETNSLARKPSGMIGASPGKIGTAVAQQHLRSILAFCNSPLMNAIEAYIEFTAALVTDDGEVTVEARIPGQLHEGVPRLHHARLHSPAQWRRLTPL